MWGFLNTILRLVVLVVFVVVVVVFVRSFVCLFVCCFNHDFYQTNPLLFWSHGRTPADELTT